MTKKKAKRKGASVTIWIPQELRNAVDSYIEATRPKTNLKAVVEAALEDFLSSHGHWPPAQTPRD